ncbi:MAG: hypothetical protein V4696_00725 [Pseudomonadota bacterium]
MGALDVRLVEMAQKVSRHMRLMLARTDGELVTAEKVNLVLAINEVALAGGGSAGVSTVNGRSGAVVLAKTDVALGNVDNTSDAAKPTSTATQAALDAKQGLDPQLTDIAALGYVANSLKAIRVNAAETGWELATIGGGAPAFSDITGVPTDTFLGRDTAGTGNAEAMSVATAKALLSLAGTNSGDQVSIVGIAGTLAEFNAALTGADFATGGGTATGANTGDQTTISGNAATATALQTARTINGVSFNGTGNITINAVDSTARAPETRSISTTAPLTGGGDLSANRTFAISAATTGAAGSMSAADKTKLDAITGTNTGDQTITLTGDVTGSGAGSFAATIGNDKVTYAKLQNISATDRLLGRDTAAAGDAEELTVGGGIEFTGAGGIQTSALTGDVTKTAGGTALTIAADAVSYAKIQNVSATARTLGRKTAGAGDIEELTLSELLDFIGSAAQGDILYRGAAAWARLAAGVDGQFLKTRGAAANPEWGAAGGDPWTTIALTSDYNNATTTFTNITDGTRTLLFTPPANTNWELEARLLVWTTAAANLPRVGLNVVAGAAAGMGGVNIWQAGATAAVSVHANAAWNNPGAAAVAQIAAGGVLTASVPYICEVIAAGRSGATPTAISLQMACETGAAATCFIKAGSFMKTRVGY